MHCGCKLPINELFLAFWKQIAIRMRGSVVLSIEFWSMKLVILLLLFNITESCFSKWFSKKEEPQKEVKKTPVIEDQVKTTELPRVKRLRAESNNQRSRSQTINNDTNSKQPQELVERSAGRSCRQDTRSAIEHSCQKQMKQGEVCRDKNNKCKGCAKKGEYIEVTVRCTQSPKVVVKKTFFLTLGWTEN